MPELRSGDEYRRVLSETRTIAVLGAHHEPQRAAFYVPAYLVTQGYRVLPVNPTLAGRELWGQPVVERLADLRERVDLVNVFRRSVSVVDHVDDILALDPLPRVVWLQLGIRNQAAALELLARGIDVVQDACTLAEHRRLGIGKIG